MRAEARDAGYLWDILDAARETRRLLQGYTLGIAWEFDLYFGLSISRVDPVPHQLAWLEVVAIAQPIEIEQRNGAKRGEIR